MNKILNDGSSVNLINIAESLLMNATVYINNNSLDEPYRIKFMKAANYLADRIKLDQELPVKHINSALTILYYNKSTSTKRVMSYILNQLGKN